jgi:hypothetical protein
VPGEAKVQVVQNMDGASLRLSYLACQTCEPFPALGQPVEQLYANPVRQREQIGYAATKRILLVDRSSFHHPPLIRVCWPRPEFTIPELQDGSVVPCGISLDVNALAG